MTQEEIINSFIQTMQDHAEPRAYDWWILVVAALSIIVSGLAIFFTYKIYKRQTNISKEQTEIAKGQKSISERQADIADQQNRIALFEKRYERYSNYFSLRRNASIIFHGLQKSIDLKSTDQSVDKKINVWLTVVDMLLSQSTNKESIEKHKQKSNNLYKTQENDAASLCQDNWWELHYRARCENQRYMQQLEKIKYLFRLSTEEKLKLTGILQGLDRSYVDANKADMTLGNFMATFIDLCEDIINFKLHKTMETQLEIIEKNDKP